MNNILIVILSCIFFNLGFSQKSKSLDSIRSFTWLNSLAYLPSIYGESEVYKYQNGRVKHRYSKAKSVWRLRWNSKKFFTTTNKENVTDSYELFLNMSDQKVFKIGLSKQDKDSLIAMANEKNYLGHSIHSVRLNVLKKYIAHSDTIEIEIEEFNTEERKKWDEMTVVIDGAPFLINLEIVTQSKDTVRFEYRGNLVGGVKDTSVDEFLTFYSIYQNHKLFRYTPMSEYFDKENLYKVILRYIAYKENTY